MVLLVDHIRRNHPERAGEDPITVAIDLMGGETAEEAALVEDDYDQWKVSELKAEAEKREPPATIADGANAREKQPWVDALRRWDTENPS